MKAGTAGSHASAMAGNRGSSSSSNPTSGGEVAEGHRHQTHRPPSPPLEYPASVQRGVHGRATTASCLWQPDAASTANPDGGSGQQEEDGPPLLGFGSSGASSREMTRGEGGKGGEGLGGGGGGGREGRRRRWEGGGAAARSGRGGGYQNCASSMTYGMGLNYLRCAHEAKTNFFHSNISIF
ncbi:hypothetical protein QYE76_061402 [Lolium multiflorum]|uniref:Uncharacterized protein n=1 Tax=Lolium multiflorum TaxID=4521 RepID=A0AAD8S164_LOLMU|nr:hypothetical protein QYE76_061402 [Lolium multiflorum]